nr:type II toxin-antitoxin system RelB/DinJ family antitoxin [Stenotrophomonas sp. PS02298]
MQDRSGHEEGIAFRVYAIVRDATSNDVVRARIDGQIKEAATVVLAEMGLSISDAIRMLLTRIAADKALPFDINRVSSDSDRKAP